MGHRRPYRRAGSERGVAIVWFALMFTAIFGMAAIAVDMGFWFTEKRKAQSAADAAALAGAWELPNGFPAARDEAEEYLELPGNDVTDANGDDSPRLDTGRALILPTRYHPDSIGGYDSVFVRTRGTSPGFFAGVFGRLFGSDHEEKEIAAQAQATLVSVVGCSGQRGCSPGPWGVPDCAYDATVGEPDCTRPLNAVFGQEVLLKSDNSTGGKFYAIQLPVMDPECSDPSGANDYGDTIVGKWRPGGLLACNIRVTGPGPDYTYEHCNYPEVYTVPTCVVPVKTGNVVGKTAAKLKERIGCNTCTEAEMDAMPSVGNLDAHIGTCRPSSANNFFCPVLRDSPRLIILPIVRNLDNSSGYATCAAGSNCNVKLVQFVYFYVKSVITKGSNHEVRGMFFRSLSPDEFDLTGGWNGDPTMMKVEMTQPCDPPGDSPPCDIRPAS